MTLTTPLGGNNAQCAVRARGGGSSSHSCSEKEGVPRRSIRICTASCRRPSAAALTKEERPRPRVFPVTATDCEGAVHNEVRSAWPQQE